MCCTCKKYWSIFVVGDLVDIWTKYSLLRCCTKWQSINKISRCIPSQIQVKKTFHTFNQTINFPKKFIKEIENEETCHGLTCRSKNKDENYKDAKDMIGERILLHSKEWVLGEFLSTTDTLTLLMKTINIPSSNDKRMHLPHYTKWWC